MKLLLGILLALVLIEAVAIVGLYLRTEPVHQVTLPLAVPRTARPPEFVADPAIDQSKRLEDLTAKVAALMKEIESLHAEESRNPVQPVPSALPDLHAEAFTGRVRELSVQAIHEEEEKRLLLEFQEKAPEFARHLTEKDKWPVRYGTVEDLEKVLLEWYPRLRTLHLKYRPRRQMLKESDPNYAEWIREDSAIDAWATAELERLYGSPLDRELRGRAGSLVFGYASRPK
jgi:hypothetical protein